MNTKYFFDTVDSVEPGVGFESFGMLHIVWLVLLIAAIVLNCVWYRHLLDSGKTIWKKTVAILLIADELFKVICLAATNQYSWGYLPLHLCSINIFLIAIHAWKPSKLLENFLYTICIPGAVAALLFPTWTELPLLNAMHLHSFTVHILLALYPVVLTVTGEIKPQLSLVPKTLGVLVLMALLIYGVNHLLNTNFMFLMSASKGNPLYWFGQNWGSHLWGFPVITAGVIAVMYLPWLLIRKKKS